MTLSLTLVGTPGISFSFPSQLLIIVFCIKSLSFCLPRGGGGGGEGEDLKWRGEVSFFYHPLSYIIEFHLPPLPHYEIPPLPPPPPPLSLSYFKWANNKIRLSVLIKIDFCATEEEESANRNMETRVQMRCAKNFYYYSETLKNSQAQSLVKARKFVVTCVL